MLMTQKISFGKALALALTLTIALSQSVQAQEDCEKIQKTFQNVSYIVVDLTELPSTRIQNDSRYPDALKMASLKKILSKVIEKNLSACVKNFNLEKSVIWAEHDYEAASNRSEVLNIKFLLAGNFFNSDLQNNLPVHVIFMAGFYRPAVLEESFENLTSLRHMTYFPEYEREPLDVKLENFLLYALMPRKIHADSRIDTIQVGPIIDDRK